MSLASLLYDKAELQFMKATKKVEEGNVKSGLKEAEQSQPVLATYHTYDLLLFLRYLREERSKAYNLMRSAQKGSKLIEIDSETLTFSEEQYRYYTARMKVIEGILKDRMGYKPKRVDNKLLESLELKMKKEK